MTTCALAVLALAVFPSVVHAGMPSVNPTDVGRMRFVSEDPAPKVFEALAAPAGGEPVGEF